MTARAPSALPALRPISMKPACETTEYARIRLTFVCTSAARLPITSEATAMTANAPSRGAPPAGTPSASGAS